MSNNNNGITTAAGGRRNRPGTKKKELFGWESKSSSSADDTTMQEDFDNPFIVQEIIQKQIRKSCKKVKRLISIPKFGKVDDEGNGDENGSSEQSSASIDKNVWIYEHMRQFLLEINLFILAHKDVCTKETQPEMKISSNMLNVNESEELMYLCPVFTPPENVPAIDYMVHIHTQSTGVLNDTKLFPSRNDISKKSMKEIRILCRRIYRIFAFSYYVHQEQFAAFEKKTHLAERFQRFLKKYEMMSSKDFLIPDEAFK